MANIYENKEDSYDKEDTYDEEEWLEMCRKARCYNGPLGGPPGLRRDEPFDIKKAQRFRQICEEMWNIKNPATPINGWGVFDPEIHKLAEEQINREEQESNIPAEPFVRGQIASIESIAIMETEFYEQEELECDEDEDDEDEDEYDKYDRLVDKYEDELYDDYEQDR